MGTVAGKHIIGFCCVNDLMIESGKWSLYASILLFLWVLLFSRQRQLCASNHLSFRKRRIYSNLTLNETYKSLSFRTNVRNLICFSILIVSGNPCNNLS